MAKKRKNITAKRVQAAERKPVIPKVEVEGETDDGPFGDDGLSIRQKEFVLAITGPACGNATKAAEMAGYAAENRLALQVTASRLLSNAMVQEAIATALTKRRATPEWAKAGLIDLARSTMANFVSVDANGKPKLDFAKAAAAGALGHIKEFTADILPGSAGELDEVIRCKIKVHDRIAALGMLLKMHGLLSDGGNGGTSPGDIPLEKHPKALRVKAAPGTTPPDEQHGAVPDGAGGPQVGKDGVGQETAD